ncbi:MAG: amino acid permease, partial [Oscillospiraceae bacterium]
TVSAAAVTKNPLLTSVVATAFAYEGWIIATSINSEIKDSKKNLPKALLFGTIAIVIIYLAYFVGISGAMPTSEFMAGGEGAVKIAFTKLLGQIGGSGLFVFVVISCLGTLNGLMLGCTRGIYALAARDMGPKPQMFKQVDSYSNMPTNSAVLGLSLACLYLFMWYGNFAGWWGIFLDVSELPIVTMYALYIPIFLWMMKSMTELGAVKRYIAPALAIAGSVFMIIAAFISHGIGVVIYMGMFTVIMGIGLLLKGKNKAQ